MTEPFFGLFQTPVGIGSRPFGLGAEGFGYIPQGATGGMPTVTQAFPTLGGTPSGSPPSYTASPLYGLATGVASVPSPASVFGQSAPAFSISPNPPGLPATCGGFSAFGAYEVPQGVTAPALLTAVAVRRGQPLGPTNDHEIEEFIYDALDMMPGTNDVEVRCEGGRVTLTGMVQHKRVKRDAGEIAWAMPAVNDVVNNVTIAARRRSRGTAREAESQASGAGRKQTQT